MCLDTARSTSRLSVASHGSGRSHQNLIQCRNPFGPEHFGPVSAQHDHGRSRPDAVALGAIGFAGHIPLDDREGGNQADGLRQYSPGLHARLAERRRVQSQGHVPGDGTVNSRCRIHIDQCTSGEFRTTIPRPPRARHPAVLPAADNQDVSGIAYTRYVALGDSITEGLCDPAPARPGVWLGWADRLAGILDGDAGLSGRTVEFANLAVRGRRIADVVGEQVPRALALRPDLVSVLVGANDLMSPTADPDALADRLADGVRMLREHGTTVLLANLFDPQFAFFLKPFRGRAAVFNANIWSIARDHHAVVLDVWGVREFRDPSMWGADRVHLSTRGHRLLAAHAAHALGIPYAETTSGESSEPGDAESGRATGSPATDLPFRTWLRVHAIPWAARRLRGISAGDGLSPKLPEALPVRTRPRMVGGPH